MKNFTIINALFISFLLFGLVFLLTLISSNSEKQLEYKELLNEYNVTPQLGELLRICDNGSYEKYVIDKTLISCGDFVYKRPKRINYPINLNIT